MHLSFWKCTCLLGSHIPFGPKAKVARSSGKRSHRNRYNALIRSLWMSYLQISEAAFKIARGIILFLVALDMLAAKKQQRKREESTSDQQASLTEPENDNPAIYPLAIPLLTGPAAIM